MTTPVGDTVAIALAPELHRTGRPARVRLRASRGVATSCVRAPIWSDASGGAMVTLATATGEIVRRVVAAFFSTRALMVTAPRRNALTVPLGDTVAIVR